MNQSSSQKEQTKLLWTVAFLLCYVVFLLFFRSVLIHAEKQEGAILKPGIFQIAIMGLLILVYHFTLLGLQAYSALGRSARLSAMVIALVIMASLLFGFLHWYRIIAGNPFSFLTDAGQLPWYAQEKTKFFLANVPLLIFFLIVFSYRFNNMINVR